MIKSIIYGYLAPFPEVEAETNAQITLAAKDHSQPELAAHPLATEPAGRVDSLGL